MSQSKRYAELHTQGVITRVQKDKSDQTLCEFHQTFRGAPEQIAAASGEWQSEDGVLGPMPDRAFFGVSCFPDQNFLENHTNTLSGHENVR